MNLRIWQSMALAAVADILEESRPFLADDKNLAAFQSIRNILKGLIQGNRSFGNAELAAIGAEAEKAGDDLLASLCDRTIRLCRELGMRARPQKIRAAAFGLPSDLVALFQSGFRRHGSSLEILTSARELEETALGGALRFALVGDEGGFEAGKAREETLRLVKNLSDLDPTGALFVWAYISPANAGREADWWEAGAGFADFFMPPEELFFAALKARIERLERLEKTRRLEADGKTLNRLGLLDAFRMMMAGAPKNLAASVAVLDLDGLEQISSEHGPQTAREVTRRLEQLAARATSDSIFIGRWAGPILVLLLPRVLPATAAPLVSKIIVDFREASFRGTDGKVLRTSLSAGVARVREGESLVSGLSEALAYLAHAKNLGGNRVASEDQAAAAAAGSAERAEEAFKWKGNGLPKVLVVDDDVNILNVLKRTFERSGFEVHVAESGSEGLLRFKRVHPDIVLLDINMPGMSGYQVCARIRGKHVDEEGNEILIPPDVAVKEEFENRSVPIIMCTADGTGESVKKSMAAGANGYMVKPIRPRELIERVRTTLSSD